VVAVSADLIPFDYAGRAVRVVTVDGELRFVAADVCAVLEHGNTTMAVAALDDDEKGLSTVETPGGSQQMVTVTEPGLYSLVLRSRKPVAKAFRRWVTHEVIPSIRKTGSYGVAQVPDMNTPEGQLQVAEMLAAGARKQIEQAAEIKRLTPKAEYVDAYVNGTEDATILRVVAKQLKVREQWLRNLLRDKKILSRRIVGTRWSNRERRTVTDYEWSARAGYETWFVQRDQPEAPRLHNGQMKTTLYVTPIGKVKLGELVTREGEAS